MKTALFMKALVSASLFFAANSCLASQTPKASYIEKLFQKKNAEAVFKGTKFEGTNPLKEFRDFLSEINLDVASDYGDLLAPNTDEARRVVSERVRAAKKAELREIFTQWDSGRADKENYLDSVAINGLVNNLTAYSFKQKLAHYVPSKRDAFKELFARKSIANVFKGTQFEGTLPENEFKTFLSTIDLDAASAHGKLLEAKTQDAQLSVCKAAVDTKVQELRKIFRECSQADDEKNFLTHADIDLLVEAVTHIACSKQIETYVPKPIPATPKAEFVKQLFKTKDAQKVFKDTEFEGTNPENEFRTFLGKINLDEASDYGKLLEPATEQARAKVLDAVRESKKQEMKGIFKRFVNGDNPRFFLTDDNINLLVNIITREFYKEQIKTFDSKAAALRRPSVEAKKAVKVIPRIISVKKHNKTRRAVNKPKQAIKRIFGMGVKHPYRNKVRGSTFKNTSELEEVVKFLQTINIQAAYDTVAANLPKGSQPSENDVKDLIALLKTAEFRKTLKGAAMTLTDKETSILINGITVEQFSKEWTTFVPKAPVNSKSAQTGTTTTGLDKKKAANNNKFILGGLALFGFSVYLYNQYKPTDVNLNTAVAAA